MTLGGPALGGAPLLLFGGAVCLSNGRFIAYGPIRAAFEPIAREVVLVDTGALCSEIYTPELLTKIRRSVWPLDPIDDARQG